MLDRQIRRQVRTEEGLALGQKLSAQYKTAPHRLPDIIKTNEDEIIDHTAFLRRTFSRNHRGFLVAVFGVVVVNGNLYQVEGANDSEVKGVQRNCGELGAISQADGIQGDLIDEELRQLTIEEQRRYVGEGENRLVALDRGLAVGRVSLEHLTIVGPGDPNEIATVVGYPLTTLPPCDECRPALLKSGYADESLALTLVGSGEPGVVRYTTLGEVDRECAAMPTPLCSLQELAVGAALG